MLIFSILPFFYFSPTHSIGSVNFTSFKNEFMKLGNGVNTPTLQPTMAVPAVPTSMPTVSPTISTGWFSGYLYEGQNCGGTVYSSYGYQTDSCLTIYNSTLAATASMITSCAGGEL
jgi:hypothetical protein